MDETAKTEGMESPKTPEKSKEQLEFESLQEEKNALRMLL
jgi:hypothetical protein